MTTTNRADIPKRITIDRVNHEILVDGIEFPWLVADNVKAVEVDGVTTAVMVEIFAEEVVEIR